MNCIQGQQFICNIKVYFYVNKTDNLTVLTRQICCTCPKPGPGFLTSYVVVYFCAKWVKMRGDCPFLLILMELMTITVLSLVT
jgi:hypothetical protein